MFYKPHKSACCESVYPSPVWFLFCFFVLFCFLFWGGGAVGVANLKVVWTTFKFSRVDLLFQESCEPKWIGLLALDLKIF